MGPVDKGLGAHGDAIADGLHLLERQLPGQQHRLIARVLQELGPLQIVYHRLGGSMPGDAGVAIPEQAHHRRILNDHRVSAGGGHQFRFLLQQCHFRVHHQSVHGDKHLGTPAVAPGHRLRQLHIVKVIRVPAGIEILCPQINGVCAAAHRRRYGVPGTRRGQNNTIVSVHFPNNLSSREHSA